MLLVSMPVGVYLYARYDQYAYVFILLPVLSFAGCLVVLIRWTTKCLKDKRVRVHLMIFTVVLLLSVYYVQTGNPYWTGREMKFRAFERQLNALAQSVRASSTDEMYSEIVPLSLYGPVTAVTSERDSDGVLLVQVRSPAGGYVYFPDASDAANTNLLQRWPNKRRLSDQWIAVSR